MALCILALIAAGGLVTSNDAALAVPDWPLAWGRLVPPLEGGIRYEFAHRVLAAAVAILTFILALWIQARDRRTWMRALAWLSFGAVIAQAGLGGAMVKLVDPRILAVSHAALAQLCFALTVAVAVGQYPDLTGTGGNRIAALAAACGLFLAVVLGANVRHGALGLTPHVIAAVVATALVMWSCMGTLIHHMEEDKLRRPALLLLSLTSSQLFLGLASYAVRMTLGDAPQPVPIVVWTTVAHVVVGALAFAAATARVMMAGKAAG